MTTFAAMFGMAACSGSAITLTLSFPTIPRSAALHTAETRALNNPIYPARIRRGLSFSFAPSQRFMSLSLRCE